MLNSNPVPTPIAPVQVERILTTFFTTQDTATVSAELLGLYDLMVESKEYVHERNLAALRTVSDVIKLVANLQTVCSI